MLLSWKWAAEVAGLLERRTDSPCPAAWGWWEAGGAGELPAGKGKAGCLMDTSRP